MPEDVVEALMGHSTQILTAYRVYSDVQLREQYEKFSFCLQIEFSPEVQKEQTERMKDLEKQNRELMKEIKSLKRIVDMHESDDTPSAFILMPEHIDPAGIKAIEQKITELNMLLKSYSK